jgi:uridine kinase
MRAQVILLAGPSGAGKSRLAERLEEHHGWPRLMLDDFYRDGTEPELPRIATGANAGLVDWDHPATWHENDALKAVLQLCDTGVADVPAYDLAGSRRTGHHELDLQDATRFTAEGIFASEIVSACREAGVLAAAYCITQHPAVTFTRRLSRDLREHRKPPPVLVRRGISLALQQRTVVRRAAEVGCRVATGDDAFAAMTRDRGE